MSSIAPRVATIDIGTNSVLLLIAELETQRSPSLRAVIERCTITRLGQDVDRTRRLHPDAIARTLACLRDYQATIAGANVQALDVVATSASRDADGARDFVQEASRILGVVPRVIDGQTEARLTFEGALAGLDLEGPVIVHDIGGGSTEVVTGTVHAARSAMGDATSLDLGSVRLTERHLHTDPPTDAEIARVRDDVVQALHHAPAPPPSATVVGIAGTVTTLAAIALNLSPYDGSIVHGSRLGLSQVEHLTQRLRTLPLEPRRQVRGLEPKRADVIVAGALICQEILRWAGKTELLVSDRGVRWGLALELASKLRQPPV